MKKLLLSLSLLGITTTCFGMSMDLKLFKAVVDGNLTRLKTLMKSENAEILVKKTEYQLLLANQVFRGFDDTIASIGGKMTLLHHAARYGHTEVVKYLVEQVGLNVDVKCENETTPLFWATKNGELETVKYLVETANANVALKDKNGNNPIYFGKRRGHSEIVDYLLEKLDSNISTNKK